MPQKVLYYLNKHYGQWLTIDAISRYLSLDAAQVAGNIQQLKNLGYEIENSPAYGFRLNCPTLALNTELLRENLGAVRVGRKIIVYNSADSTNDVAWEYVREPDCDGLAIFAEVQRAGRGRIGRSWQAKRSSSILCSVLLCRENQGLAQPLTILAGLSVAEAVEETAQVAAGIKWPNDVTVAGRKIAGVLIECRIIDQNIFYVIGVGINCTQKREDFDPEFRDSACSLQELSAARVDRIATARCFLSRLDYWIQKNSGGEFNQLHDQWKRRCDNIGRRLTIINDGRDFCGRVIDVSCDNGLILQLDNGAVKVFDGASTSVKKGV